MVVKSVGAVSCAKVAGALYALMGLIIGACISLIAMLGGFASASDEGAMFGALFGVGAIILAPVFYGVMGFVMTFIAAALYNVVAGRVGGVEINVQ